MKTSILDKNLLGFDKRYYPISLRELIFSYDYEMKGTDLICIGLIGFLSIFLFMYLISEILYFSYNMFFEFIYLFLLFLFVLLYIRQKNINKELKNDIVILNEYNKLKSYIKQYNEFKKEIDNNEKIIKDNL